MRGLKLKEYHGEVVKVAGELDDVESSFTAACWRADFGPSGFATPYMARTVGEVIVKTRTEYMAKYGPLHQA